jgi:hypothetical protein
LELGEYPTANSRSEAETGFREAEAVTAGNGNEYPISKERH